ncbi:MAG: diguanylate cyclase [Candidatus Thiodiazotropha sp. (ex Myrtea sp. 'scaly one' KF741663)]|nr:diguanylate cyclase [Candidatus Thiodiazotropha sp. (ex Myrtea sp. 'scaly one' KF741663)]
MRITIQTKLFFSHFAAIILVSGSVGTYFYQSAIDNLTQALRSRLQNSAALVSQGLGEVKLDQVRHPEDRILPVYKQSVSLLQEFVKANPDIAFIYVMRREEENVSFVLDSDSDDPAMPGELYPHHVPALMEGFVRASVDEEITQDRWGSFLSGYSPLEAGDGVYLVGIDMYANEVESKLKEIRIAGMLSFVLSLLLAMIFSRYLSLNFTQRIVALMDRFSTIAPEQFVQPSTNSGDELNQLAQSFNQMAERLESSRSEIEVNQEALRDAHDELEQRVKARTSELLRTNEQLRDEIAERTRMEMKLEEISRTDYLTGILNRRAITQRLEALAESALNEDDSFCIILIDLDHFKEINDSFGHDVGDQTLKHAVERLRNGVRDSDLLGRWGGEEFLIMSPQTSLDEAEGLAQRLCQSLAGSRVEAGNESVSVTGSFGVSRFRPGKDDLDTCLKRTDDALYSAKTRGRNCIVVSDAD